jgi:hypothetical protein
LSELDCIKDLTFLHFQVQLKVVALGVWVLLATQIGGELSPLAIELVGVLRAIAKPEPDYLAREDL